MVPNPERGHLVVEAAACATELRRIVASLEASQTSTGKPVDELAAALERLQVRVGLLAEHEQERRLRRFVIENRKKPLCEPTEPLAAAR